MNRRGKTVRDKAEGLRTSGGIDAQRMQYRFSKLGFLNDFDMQITAKLDLGIYESLPFEKVDFKANLLNGKLEIERPS